MYCRNCGHNLEPNSSVCARCGVPVGLGNHYCPGCGVETAELAVVCVRCGTGLQPPPPPRQAQSVYTVNGVPYTQKSKLAAGLLGILLGSLGIHNFYLGFTNRAILQLVVTLVGGTITCGLASAGIAIWGLVEGIQILTGSIHTDANGVELGD